jgi:hypothetical protein
VPGLEPAFTVDARLGPLEDHGVTRAGHRRVVPIAGGRVGGLPDGQTRFDAEILPGGADWQVVRPDGTIEIDTRYSARTPAGEHLHFRTAGVRSGPPDVVLLPGGRVPGDVRAPARLSRAVDLHRLRGAGRGQRVVHGLSRDLRARYGTITTLTGMAAGQKS